MKIFPALLLSMFVTLAVPTAPAAETAESILRRVAETYRNLTEFHFAVVESTTTRSEGFERRTETRIVTAQDASGRLRVELDDGANAGVAVKNGETSWVYLPRFKIYSQVAAVPIHGGAGTLDKAAGMDFARAADRVPMRYRPLLERLLAANIAGEETVKVGDSEIQCQIVEADYSTPPGMAEGKIHRVFWIDRAQWIVVRELSEASMVPENLNRPVTVSQQISFAAAKAAGPLSDELFAFEPPADARHVEDLQEARENPQSWIGRDAIDFLLPDLAGQPMKLADARGNVVLLDFWASWCLPCRHDMPRIEALYRELRDQGLRVFGINSEPVETALAYMRENGYTFPSLLDKNMGVSRNYGVRSLPTVIVVNREGKVSAYLDGARSAEELRQAVDAAGL